MRTINRERAAQRRHERNKTDEPQHQRPKNPVPTSGLDFATFRPIGVPPTPPETTKNTNKPIIPPHALRSTISLKTNPSSTHSRAKSPQPIRAKEAEPKKSECPADQVNQNDHQHEQRRQRRVQSPDTRDPKTFRCADSESHQTRDRHL